MNDERVIEAANEAVRVIVRRPHAYSFLRDHRKSRIPGLVVLNAEGEFIGAVSVPSRTAVEKVVELLRE